jgi:hypothetical protein
LRPRAQRGGSNPDEAAAAILKSGLLRFARNDESCRKPLISLKTAKERPCNFFGKAWNFLGKVWKLL